MLIPVILSGGAGTRLWPLSRELYPKQFLPLTTDRTMIQETALRAAGLKEMAAPIVVCNEAHRFMVAEQLQQVGIEPQTILLEPTGRNTAPALAVAALAALAEAGEDAGGDAICCWSCRPIMSSPMSPLSSVPSPPRFPPRRMDAS